MLKIDKENEKFSLGIKQLEPNPWEDILKKYTVGSEITGPVKSVTDFGVFVQLEDGIDAMEDLQDLVAEVCDEAGTIECQPNPDAAASQPCAQR